MSTTNFFVDENSKESSEKRVARFKQWFNRSRIGNLVKDGRYRIKSKTERQEREAALVREEHRAERERKKFYM